MLVRVSSSILRSSIQPMAAAALTIAYSPDTLSVVGVFAQAEVGDHQDLGCDMLGDFDGLLHDPVITTGGRAVCVLLLWDAEEEDCRNAQLGRLDYGVTKPVQGDLKLAGHRRDFPAQVLAVINEERIDQIVSGEPRFADHVPEPRVTPKAPGTMKRITSGGLEGHYAVPRWRRREWSGGTERPSCHSWIVTRRAIRGLHHDSLAARRSIERTY